MKKEQILYIITRDDIKNVSSEMNISVSEKDFTFIKDKVGNFIGDKWHDAIEYALWELEESKKK
ncbi:MAG: hypothetical protein A3C11_02095 [Candidatus Sungbacteria bacterium RIFCSPHIGHO2_02_FULL_49_12]|uniref:Uncharacterized protein n=1 Tax=Candidatus Sungbacteria bacterium RIFCSPHIGHO2_02_FULL_49_12 TaxID=1802271 RepID=A0A1G2KQB2_9BACT|nr:MAG: hypothetical protein A3C11_02095 [Candidatus Sungbacteria bacterium RIFCSPHIGHO2_02_FULL_49_12]